MAVAKLLITVYSLQDVHGEGCWKDNQARAALLYIVLAETLTLGLLHKIFVLTIAVIVLPLHCVFIMV